MDWNKQKEADERPRAEMFCGNFKCWNGLRSRGEATLDGQCHSCFFPKSKKPGSDDEDDEQGSGGGTSSQDRAAMVRTIARCARAMESMSVNMKELSDDLKQIVDAENQRLN